MAKFVTKDMIQHMYMDCREMNTITIKNMYPIPRIKDPFGTLHNIIIYDAFALMNMFNFQCCFTPTWSIGPFLVTKIKNICNQNLIGIINKHVNLNSSIMKFPSSFILL